MHEWKETFEFNYNTGLYDLGGNIHSLTTWIFEAGSFVPCGKISDGKHYSIITDHLGTPIEAYNQEGELIWECEQDLYGNSRQGFAKENFRCPFKYQGQYYDPEIELCYNRFRYYHPETGRYISQDPIELLGGFNVFAYVSDSNAWVDVLGLDAEDPFALKHKEHLRQQEEYGKGGNKTLENGRIRYYSEISPAKTEGEMAGRRTVREWDPNTDRKRVWMETIDKNGNVRIVRPEVSVTNGSKVHYEFDSKGNYIGNREGFKRNKYRK